MWLRSCSFAALAAQKTKCGGWAFSFSPWGRGRNQCTCPPWRRPPSPIISPHCSGGIFGLYLVFLLVEKAVMEPRAARKEGMRVLVVALLLAVAARAFLIPTPPLGQQQQQSILRKEQHQQQRPPRRHPTRAAGVLARKGTSGAGGLSATLPIDAVTRTEALNGFFAALVLSTAAVVPPSDRLGVVDDLLADCPSVRERMSERGVFCMAVGCCCCCCLLVEA